MAGQHFWRTEGGAVLCGRWDTQKIPSYPLLMENEGYHIGYTYKVWKPGTPENAPYGGKRTQYDKAGQSFNGFSQVVTREMNKGKSVEKAKGKLIKEVRQNFKNFMDQRSENQPFCFWFGPTNVHRTWVAGSGKRIWGMDPDELKGKMPPFLPDVHEVRQDLNDYLGEAQAFDMAIGVMVDELKKMGVYENTIIAISGDHGAPGFPHGKCNLYDFGSQVPLLLLGPGIKGGRVVDDFVSLPDLAPTFLEAGQVQVPDVMTGKSLWPVLSSSKEGLVDSSRTQVYIGRERHFPTARKHKTPYPQRAIRTRDYLFIVNFKPERYPMGDHYHLGTAKEPSVKDLIQNTGITIPDEDKGPTKAWIVSNRKTEYGKFFFEHAYGKRPKYELYSISKDPHQMNNLANNPEFKEIVEDLKAQLMKELEVTQDPRLIENGHFFENMSSKRKS
jgi:arylsulfatase A-like enzyme